MNDYKGFKSQALDFNVYSDGVSVSSVVQEFALAPETADGKPVEEITEGSIKWTIAWAASPPAYTDYPEANSIAITSKGKNVYWERQITYYSDGEVKASAASKSTMLDVDFINSIGITAKKITVIDDKKNLVFEADSFDPEGLVKIGGFEVDSNSLSTGKDTNKVIIKSNITLDDVPGDADGNVGVYRYADRTYVLLDYIESTGKEYIDLGIQAKNIASATLNFTYTGVVSSGAALDANKYNAVYGTDAGIQIARKETGAFTDGAGTSSVILDLNTRYVCEATYDYSDTSMGGVGVGTLELRKHGQDTAEATLTRNLSGITTDGDVNNVYLFSAFDNDNGGGAAYFSKAKIYSCQVTGLSDNPSYNFIPVLQVDTNTPGLYETNTNTFYTNNSKQGGLIAGPIADVVPVDLISIALGAEEPNQAPFRVTNKGEVTASAGTIGGFNIGTNTIASGDDTEKVGIRLTSTDGKNKDAKVIQAGTNFSVDASGNIEAEGGNIGGWEIKGDEKTLSSGEGTATVGLNAAGNTTTPAIWAGATDADNAPCRIYPDGKFQLYKGTIEINSEGSSNTTLGGLISKEEYQSTQINSNGVGFINTGSDTLLWGFLGKVDYTGTSSFKIIPDYSSIAGSSKNGVTFNSSSKGGVVVERQALTTVWGQQRLVVEAATLDNTALCFNYLTIDDYDSDPAISSDSTTCGLSSTTKGTLAVNTSTKTASWIFSDRFFSNKKVNLDDPGENNQYLGNEASVVGLSSEAGVGYAFWAGTNDALHEKEFRVSHDGDLTCGELHCNKGLYCTKINNAGAISMVQVTSYNDDASANVIAEGEYKIVAGTTDINEGDWKYVFTIPENWTVIGGWATIDANKNEDSGYINAPNIDWNGYDLWVRNNAGGERSISWMFIYKR